MSLHDRLVKQNGATEGVAVVQRPAAAARQPAAAAAPEVAAGDPYAELKGRIHHACIAKLGPELFKQETTGDLAERVLHAVTEQLTLDRTPLARGASLGLHESQSRMWENLVGRSRPFWEHFYPALQEQFREQLRRVDVETFYRAVNVVRPSLIRVEADEITYNLHIMLRFELEKALLEGSLRVEALPEAWTEKMRSYLGETPPSDADGVMQDIHWSQGSIGYFPTYSLGNIISVQLFEAARKAHPSLLEEIRRGQFSTLLGWMRQHVHRHGRKFLPREILKRATGSELTVEPYLGYLQRKFGEIYGVRTGGAAAAE